jgi:hypothetical protein
MLEREGGLLCDTSPRALLHFNLALGGLPGTMRVEADPGSGVSAKTVGELRRAMAWPENAVITVPQERYPKSVVKVSKASVVTHYPPKR